ncbi:hypothetical protein AAK899_02030 [Erysipelotrichaceae bacterium 51-3]|uniref:hypothetical protein n=1 Tax=Allobaculum sp. JKK-2023 TaxID=3108943 RepID=UPI002B05A34A|nr:hypothetical protein [Allobaculum sp. JKK-2023]
MADDFKKFEDKILSDEIRHDEDVIDRKRGDLKEHELELSEDKSKLMKDLRKEEIKHDEKVIDRKEKDAADHEAKLKENEQAITGKH